MTKTLQQLEPRLIELYKKVQAEKQAKEKIKNSEEFQELEKQIEELKDKQTEMMDGVFDSSLDFDLLKQEALEEIKATKNYQGFGALKVKTKQSKKVNCNKLLKIIGGDMDMFLVHAKITQKTINELKKEHVFKNMRKELDSCIEKVGFPDIVDVEIDKDLIPVNVKLVDLPF